MPDNLSRSTEDRSETGDIEGVLGISDWRWLTTTERVHFVASLGLATLTIVLGFGYVFPTPPSIGAFVRSMVVFIGGAILFQTYYAVLCRKVHERVHGEPRGFEWDAPEWIEPVAEGFDLLIEAGVDDDVYPRSEKHSSATDHRTTGTEVDTQQARNTESSGVHPESDTHDGRPLRARLGESAANPITHIRDAYRDTEPYGFTLLFLPPVALFGLAILTALLGVDFFAALVAFLGFVAGAGGVIVIGVGAYLNSQTLRYPEEFDFDEETWGPEVFDRPFFRALPGIITLIERTLVPGIFVPLVAAPLLTNFSPWTSVATALLVELYVAGKRRRRSILTTLRMEHLPDAVLQSDKDADGAVLDLPYIVDSEHHLYVYLQDVGLPLAMGLTVVNVWLWTALTLLGLQPGLGIILTWFVLIPTAAAQYIAPRFEQSLIRAYEPDPGQRRIEGDTLGEALDRMRPWDKSVPTGLWWVLLVLLVLYFILSLLQTRPNLLVRLLT